MWSGVQISTKIVKIFQSFPCPLDLAKVILDQMSQNQSTLMDKQLIHGENKKSQLKNEQNNMWLLNQVDTTSRMKRPCLKHTWRQQ